MNTELCFNLWAYTDRATQVIQRVSARAYAISGSDETKLKTLKALSKSDYEVSGSWPLPDTVSIIEPDGSKIPNSTLPGLLNDSNIFSSVFSTPMQELADSIATQFRFAEHGPEYYKLPFPENPLTVTTFLVENPDGSITPVS